MRKALIAVIVASALFAVGAMAAELTVNSDDVASGEAPVGSCATSANVIAYTTDGDVAAAGATADWQANGATIELMEASSGACVGADVDIAIGVDTGTDDTADSWVDGSCNPDPVGSLIYTCTFADTNVRPIVEVAVLVNGNSLEASV